MHACSRHTDHGSTTGKKYMAAWPMSALVTPWQPCWLSQLVPHVAGSTLALTHWHCCSVHQAARRNGGSGSVEARGNGHLNTCTSLLQLQGVCIHAMT